MEYITTRSIEDFKVVIDDLRPELGERFPTSIENWCGIGARPYPLPVWAVYLARTDSGPTPEPVGICSYYRQTEDPVDRFWLGWIGVRPNFRRQGRASAMLERVYLELCRRGARKICVYTSNPEAVALYKSFGMSIDGTFSSTGLVQAAATGDEVLLSMSVI